MPRTYIFVGPAVSFTNRSNLSFLRNVVKSLVRKIYRILYISYLFFLFTEVSLLAVPLLSNDAIFSLSFQKMLSSLKLVFELSKAFLTTSRAVFSTSGKHRRISVRRASTVL